MFEARNPDYHAAILDKMRGQHLMHHLGMGLQSIEPGRVVASVPLARHTLQQFGYAHGGTISTLADVAMGFAAYTLVDAETGVVTAELRVSFLRPGEGHTLTAVGTVLKAGKGMVFTECELFVEGPQGRVLVAKASSIMATVPAKAVKP